MFYLNEYLWHINYVLYMKLETMFYLKNYMYLINRTWLIHFVGILNLL